MALHVHLIRHAACEGLGTVLSGRSDAHLTPQGRREAGLAAERLGGAGIDMVFTSPRERAVETAEIIAYALDTDLEVAEQLDEIDFGSWSGLSFEVLAGSEDWRRFNTCRSIVRPPEGESLLEVQARIVDWLERYRRSAPAGRIVAVSHGDVLRAAVAHYLGMPLDLLLRFDIDPASITSLELDDWGPRLLRLNERPAGG